MTTDIYRRVWLPHIVQTGAAERFAYLPDSDVVVPPSAFGETDLARPTIAESPVQGAGGKVLHHPPVDAYVLRSAIVHGRTNLAFCRPGTAVCELRMDCYVQWAFRRLAALRGLRYGCVIGPHIPPRRDWMHHNSFRIDPEHVASVLADPRFVAG